MVAPIILLVTNGRSFTKALANVDGAMPCLLARLTYFSIAFSPLIVLCLSKRLAHNVNLVLGPSKESIPTGINIINIKTAKEMLTEIKKLKNIDIAICAAAVSDWTIDKPSTNKIKKQNINKPVLNLSLNPDILQYIASKKNNRPQLVIGFAAETDNLIKNAQEKLKKKNCDWILANDVSKNPEIFGGDNNCISLITKNNVDEWNICSKKEVAEKLAKKVIESIESN